MNLSKCLLGSPLAAVLILSSNAQQFHVVGNPGASTSNLNGVFMADLGASLIGDYDAATNPTGTRTVPGFFGGGGNSAIPLDLGLGGTLVSALPPTGSADVFLDQVANTVTFTNLDMDLLGGGTLLSDVAGDALFSTFRTFAPDSLYVGGVTIPLPLGQQSVSNFHVVQTGPAFATLTPTTPQLAAFMTAVPVDMSMIVDFNGVPTPVGPIPALLPVAGTVNVVGANLTLALAIANTVQQTIIDPVPGFQITDVPLPIPTIFPAGSTANLLLNGTVDSVTLDLVINALLVASGPMECGFSNYCVNLTPNSTGQTGLLAISGSTDVSMQSLTLDASQLPINQFGFFLMSPAQGLIQLPAPGQGALCMGSPFFRLNSNILFSGGTGTMQLVMDFQNLPQNQTFQAGSTWNFQLWHRDQNPSNTSNTTNAATVFFCQ